ncbi:hypothetical protein OE88DRAFT_1732116 [Heliocybe sulcata]|uniref:UFSP1/2/DUB catalytic domain-containing protein n=1 Tax=Heliocybe sulcata TaxID=5364 RepID=A0A5C3ND56_9AGAM|nr:hypothetical protein OE88DRAFT_1732116 [Heliocybe sulcata]
MQGGHDSDVEFVCQVSPDTDLLCQFCQADLQSLTVPEREHHYNAHLAEPDSAPTKPSLSIPRKTKKFSPFQTFWKDTDHNIFWHPRLPTPPPSNFTPALIPLLARSLSSNNSVVRAVLCFDQTTHVGTEGWDRGWGCGYRNFLMVCTALLSQTQRKEYWDLLEKPTPPGVRNLQKWIEEAWKQGYDKEGATQLKRQLVDTKQWIGTSDIYVAFSSRGVPCRLVDFSGVSKDPSKLTAWVRAYFDGTDEGGDAEAGGTEGRKASIVERLPIPIPGMKKHKEKGEEGAHLRGGGKVSVSTKMPLILQHQGHSRSIVGYVAYHNPKAKGGQEVELLIFDPGRCYFYSTLLNFYCVADFVVCRKPRQAIRAAALHEKGSSSSFGRRRASPEVMEVEAPTKPLSASSSSGGRGRGRSPSVSDMYVDEPVPAASRSRRSPSVSEMYTDEAAAGPAKPTSRKRSPSVSEMFADEAAAGPSKPTSRRRSPSVSEMYLDEQPTAKPVSGSKPRDRSLSVSEMYVDEEHPKAGPSKSTAGSSGRRSPSVSEMYLDEQSPVKPVSGSKPRPRSPSVSEMDVASPSKSASAKRVPEAKEVQKGFKPLPASKMPSVDSDKQKTSKYFQSKEKEKENGKPKLVQTVLHPINSLRNKSKNRGKGREKDPSTPTSPVKRPNMKKRKTAEADEGEVVEDSEPERERQRGRKRSRGPPSGEEEVGGEVIEIPSSDDEHMRGGAPSPYSQPGTVRGGAFSHTGKDSVRDVRRAFGVGEAALRKKDKYQILWFPMDAPLGAREREKRRVVTSAKVE